MKIKNFILKNNDIVTSAKESAVSTILAYNKTYELLHKQLWRKGRVSTSNNTLSFNGRTCKAITKWNIKSPSSNPYNKDNYNDLGLNQLFVGQSPYKAYQGNPKDGIYHDDCFIFPKATQVDWITSSDMYGWYAEQTVEMGGGDTSTWTEIVYSKIVKKFDDFGNVIVDNVTLQEVFIDVPSTDAQGNPIIIQQSQGFFLKTYLNGVLLSSKSVDETTTLTGLTNLTALKNIPKYMNIDFNASGMGSPITTEIITDINFTYQSLASATISNGDNSSVYIAIQNLLTSSTFSKIYIFVDGTAIQLIPPFSFTIDTGTGDQQIISSFTLNAQVMYLPLVYVDTGDLVINKFDFIDNWDDMFKLYVHEDSHWYHQAIKVAIFVASVVVGYFTAGAGFEIMGAMLGAIGGYGIVRGDKAFQLIGAIGTMGTGFTGITQNNLTQSFIANGFSQDGAKAIASDMIMNMSFGQMATSFVSTAGLSNMLSIGNSMFSVYSVLTSKDLEKYSNTTNEEEATTKMVGMVEEEEQPFNDYINKIMRIGDLK